MSFRQLSLTSALWTAFTLNCLAQVQASGRVVDHLSGPVANGRVRLIPMTRIPQPPVTAATRQLAPASQRHESAIAGPDGSFALSGLARGTYRVCADAPGRELLDPCQWDPSPIPVSIGDRPISGLALQLKRGATLSIRVDDNTRALAAAEKTGKGVLLVGVWSAVGVFHPARITSEDASGRTYSLEVPVGVTARVTVTPSSLGLQDTTGRTFAAGSGAATDVILPPAGQTLRYKITP